MAFVPTSMLSKINDSIAAALKRKLDANGVRNDATTTDAGYVLDARMGKTLGDRAEKLELKVGDLYFDTDSSGRWGYKSSKNGAVTPFRNPTGNAEAGDVLRGIKFANKDYDALVGTMPNRGNLNVTLTPTGNNTASQDVAAGYYSGGTITANGSKSYNAGYAAKAFRRILLGTGGNGNYSATGVPNWQGLTNDNFVFVPTKVHYWGGTYNTDGAAQYVVLGTSAGGDIYPSVSYNAGNGIVTVTGCSAEAYSNGYDRHGSSANVAVTGNIYCVVAN